MKLAYFPNQTALQSETVWQSFLVGCQKLGITLVENSMNADAALIWSVLWNGRMKSNQLVYEHFRKQNKPVFILEVGSLIRGKTWKLSLNHINNTGMYPIFKNRNLDITLQNNNNRKDHILIALQHTNSLQWDIDLNTWVTQQITSIRSYTDRPIVIRPHPRCYFHNTTSFPLEIANKIPNTYDKFDIDYNCHAVINYNSGVGIQSVIAGTPVITGNTSLAYSVSNNFSDLENLILPDRTDWFTHIKCTEWTTEELMNGYPTEYLLNNLT